MERSSHLFNLRVKDQCQSQLVLYQWIILKDCQKIKDKTIQAITNLLSKLFNKNHKKYIKLSHQKSI